MPGSTTNAAFSEYIYFDGKRAARRDYQSNVFYYFSDQVGSARGMAEVASGSHTATPCFDADFYPFGGEHDFLNSCPQNYKFMGKERDPETNNDEFGARSYASAYGRFLSADWSSTPTPVPYANLTNPQTLNLYAIVSDDPESFADLDGHGTDTQSNTGTCATGTSESCGAQQAAAQNAGTAQNQNNDVSLNVGGTSVVGTFTAGTFADGSKGANIDVVAQNCDSCNWAQTVTRTGAGASSEHTDREQGTDHPLYPGGDGAKPGGNLSDTPSTHPGGAGSFKAVSTLGIADTKNKTFKVTGSITYGYSVSKGGAVTENRPRVATRSEAKSSIAVLKKESPGWKIIQ